MADRKMADRKMTDRKIRMFLTRFLFSCLSFSCPPFSCQPFSYLIKYRRSFGNAHSEQSQICIFFYRAQRMSGRAGGGAQWGLGGVSLATGGDAHLRRNLFRADHRGAGIEHDLSGARNPPKRTARQLPQRRDARIEDADRFDPALPRNLTDAAGGRAEAQRVLPDHA